MSACEEDGTFCHLMSTAFDTTQYSDCYPDGIENNYWNLSRNRLLYQLIGEGNCSDILEIGCGRGLVVDFLRKRGVEVVGCDTAKTTPISAAAAAFLQFETNAFDLESERKGRTKTILLLDMLEHLPEPEKFLQQCRAEFPNAARYIITLPARQEIWSNYDEYYGHFRRYDLSAATRLVNSAELSVSDSGYFFHSLYAASRVLTMLGRDRETVVRAPSGAVANRINRAIAAFLSAESRVLPKTIPGSSLYVVAEAR